MQASGISANPLLMLNSLLRASGSAASDVFAPPSSDKTDPAKSAASTTVLPPSSATQLSFDSILALQSVDNTDTETKSQSLSASAAPTPEETFLKEAHKSPMQRLRDQILQSMGMTEESLAQLPAEERRAAEDKISKILREKIKEGMGVDSNASESNDDMLSAVA